MISIMRLQSLLPVFVLFALIWGVYANAADQPSDIDAFEQELRQVEESITLRCLQQWPGQQIMQLYCEEAHHAAFSMVLYNAIYADMNQADLLEQCMDDTVNTDAWGTDYRRLIVCLEDKMQNDALETETTTQMEEQ